MVRAALKPTKACDHHFPSCVTKNSIAEDLSVSSKTVERWLSIFENLYFAYRIAPYGSMELAKALKKDQKLFLWDWSTVADKGARMENFVASMLLKFCHLREDSQGFQMRLCYLRDREKRELDFVVLQDEPKPTLSKKASHTGKGAAAHFKVIWSLFWSSKLLTNTVCRPTR